MDLEEFLGSTSALGVLLIGILAALFTGIGAGRPTVIHGCGFGTLTLLRLWKRLTICALRLAVCGHSERKSWAADRLPLHSRWHLALYAAHSSSVFSTSEPAC